MASSPPSPLPLAVLALAGLGSSACAEVYTPRPSAAVVISGNTFGGYRVYKHGENMGNEWSIRDAVSGDPRAESEADTATGERIGGIVTGILGAVGVGVGTGLLLDDWDWNQGTISSGTAVAGVTLLVGGLVLAITGGALQDAAHTHFFNAANMYNDDMAVRGITPSIYLPVQPVSVVETRPVVMVAPGPGYAPRPIELQVAPGAVSR